LPKADSDTNAAILDIFSAEAIKVNLKYLD
jgi:hypothetical protein